MCTNSSFYPNEIIKKIIELNIHLNEEQKTTKQTVSKMLSNCDTLLKEFNSNQANFEIKISKIFDQIRRKIDLHREELKNKIDDIALEMIRKTKEKEKNLLNDLNIANSNIINSGVEEEVKSLLDELRKPNMIFENIKSSIEKLKVNIYLFKF